MARAAGHIGPELILCSCVRFLVPDGCFGGEILWCIVLPISIKVSVDTFVAVLAGEEISIEHKSR